MTREVREEQAREEPDPAETGATTRTSIEMRLAEPRLDLARRLFPRGLAGLLPDERTRFLGICALTGALAALAAVLFRLALRLVTTAFFGPEADLVKAASALPPWQRIVTPAAGAVLAVAIARLAARGGSGGVAGILEALSLKKGIVSLESAVSRAFASLFSIGAGGSIGREGPIVQLGAAVGSRAGRLLGLTDERIRVLCACGAAAGFAAAYGTPMAATLFVVEVIVGTATVELLGPAAVSAVVATAVSRLALGEGGVAPLYGEKPFVLVSPWETIPYLALAVLAALLATVFLGLLDAAEWALVRGVRSRVSRALLGGLLVGLIGCFVPEVYGNGFETTRRLLEPGTAEPLAFLAIVLIAKALATAVTVGSGGAGGVFTPTLLVGAALGAAVGEAANAVAPTLTAPAAAYALVGTAAVLAATTHAPLMASVFVYEVTDDYAIVLPLLLTSHLAASFAKALRPRSIYEEDAERRGVSLERSHEERALKTIRAADLLRPVPTLPPDLPLSGVLEAFTQSRTTSLYVAAEGGRLLGVVDIADAREALAQGPAKQPAAGDLVHPASTVPEKARGSDLSRALYRGARDEVAVLDGAGALRGIVTRQALQAAVDREVIRRALQLQESAMLSPAHGRDAASGRRDRPAAASESLGLTPPMGLRPSELALEADPSLPPVSRLEQVRVPRSFAGRSLAEANLRARFGLNVLAIVHRRPDGAEERHVAHADALLMEGEDLVVIGDADAIERWRSLR